MKFPKDSILYVKPVGIFELLRNTRNWSPKDVADRIDRSYSAIYSLEEGIRRPTDRMIDAYAHLFQVPRDLIIYYLYEENVPENYSDFLYEVMGVIHEGRYTEKIEEGMKDAVARRNSEEGARANKNTTKED